ncbi:phosphatase PAP2 family protein [Terasakiella sp. A23]|uniref:phosphatase PAP2 family protein n=1 Tax=Terasakiella sp. FCG-A23 TaxID=3080561 RepID=UPI002953EAA3|nr:phosphatase PAP2 family protein [Terasakiella sp. A23]MDV7341514.1 phosphatase PAP2 family protein [Terasakiella sp. A23]
MLVEMFDYIINVLMAVVLIVGGYQFYFFPQRRPIRQAIEFSSRLDDKIPFMPQWVWIYSGLYYPVIILVVLTIDSFEKFNYTVFSFLLLLVFQLFFFFILPVSTPKHWREYSTTENIHTRFLAFVHKFDSSTNSFPSMHVSVAMLCALHLDQNLVSAVGQYSVIAFAFPVLIAISTLFTKQHYWIDLPAGAVLGWGVFEIYQMVH